MTTVNNDYAELQVDSVHICTVFRQSVWRFTISLGLICLELGNTAHMAFKLPLCYPCNDWN